MSQRSTTSLDRRSALALVLLASAWSDSVIASRPPTLRMAFGGEDGFAAIEVTVNGETFTVTPEQLAQALR